MSLNSMSVKPKILPGNPSDPIACYRGPNFPSDGNTKARPILLTWSVNCNKMAVLYLLPCPGHSEKGCSIQESVGLGKREFAQKPLSLCNLMYIYVSGAMISRSHRQPLPSFGATPIENSSALFRRHPFQEAMRPGTLNTAWLIRPFHDENLFYLSAPDVLLLALLA